MGEFEKSGFRWISAMYRVARRSYKGETAWRGRKGEKQRGGKRSPHPTAGGAKD